MNLDHTLWIVAPKDKVIDVGGSQLKIGTSLYIFRVNRVVWVKEIEDGSVTLVSINDSHDVKPRKIAQMIEEGKICIESQPPI